MPATIKIRLLTSVSSTDYSYAAGDEVDAPEERAKDLIRAEYAVLIAETPASTREKAVSSSTRETRKK